MYPTKAPSKHVLQLVSETESKYKVLLCRTEKNIV